MYPSNSLLHLIKDKKPIFSCKSQQIIVKDFEIHQFRKIFSLLQVLHVPKFLSLVKVSPYWDL